MSQLSNIFFQQARAQGAGGKYPFVDSASMRSREGLTIPPEMFSDARVYPPGGGVTQSITRVTRTATGISFTISDAAHDLCTGTRTDDDTSDTTLLVDALGRSCGVLVTDADFVPEINAIPAGVYNFPLGALEFVPTCVVPQKQDGVQAIELDDGEIFTGDVWLVGEDGVVVSYADSATMRIDIVGDPQFKQRACLSQAGTFTPRVAVQTINGIVPGKVSGDSTGDLTLTTGANITVDNVLRVERVTNGLRLRLIGEGV